MYVCVCRGITDRDIRKAMMDGATSVDDIEQRLGAGTGCGGCRDYTRRLLEDSRFRTTVEQLATSAA